jgi:hypothetical protein
MKRRDGMPKTLLVAVLALTMCSAATAVSGSATAEVEPTGRIAVRGTATLDGAPFDAQFLGAVVVRRGLVTPCQSELPRVRAGRFNITVFGKAEASGCGVPGAEVFLWTFVQDQIVYSSDSVSWPKGGHTARFRPTFSIAAPTGGVGPIVGFAGEIFDQEGTRQPAGARVVAYIGTTRCAVASTRPSEDFIGFSIDVVGPDAIAGCALGGTITFRVDGEQAVETAVNAPGQEDSLNLTLP